MVETQTRVQSPGNKIKIKHENIGFVELLFLKKKTYCMCILTKIFHPYYKYNNGLSSILLSCVQ
jgi:hypothetical protein